jgi:hypothetical protein
MNNAEQVAYQEMLRGCEESLFSQQVGDLHDDVETPVHVWIDANVDLPVQGCMVWAAVPSAVLCAYQTFLLYQDSDGYWRDNTGILFFRKVAFWQSVDVPVYKGTC